MVTCSVFTVLTFFCFLIFSTWFLIKCNFTCLQFLNYIYKIVCLETGEETSGGFDSGHGSSLDRSYNPGTALNRGQYYYNIPAPNRSGDYHHGGSGGSHHHTRETSGLLDLANREQRGSAFELYKKPSTALHHYLDNNLRSVITLYSLWMHCVLKLLSSVQGYTNTGSQVAQATKFGLVMPNIYGSSVWNLLHITLLVPRILRWLLGFWKICGLQLQGIVNKYLLLIWFAL